MTSRILKEAGYHVLQASGSDEVLSRHADELSRVDLVISDVVMPQLSGPRLAETLLEREPGLKVLFVSGHTAQEIEVRGLSTQELNFLPKPYSAEKILHRVRKILRP